MTAGQQYATKTVTFRHEGYDFDVQLEVESKDNKVISISDSTSKFFDYLKRIQIISPNRDIYEILNAESIDHVTFGLFFKDNFFKVRKKAELLGLKVIPGEKFEECKKESLRKANLENSCLKQVAAV